jgi:hypothetical protein
MHVQHVHDSAQTFSRVKKVTRGGLRMFKMFRLFSVLPKLSHESKK